MKYIGITPRINRRKINDCFFDFLSINTYYLDFIKVLGFCPLILPFDLHTELLQKCDGFLIIGGDDIDPKYYHENNQGSILENPLIDQIDFEIMDYAIHHNQFIIGICRGIQIINVYFGGNLIQDLADRNPLHHQNHLLTKVNDHPLLAFFDDVMLVNSMHHQAIKELGDNLISLFQNDGIIEMIVHQKYPLVGVQWHPERMDLDHQLKFKQIINFLMKGYNINNL